jgi:hypothetical protein
MKYCEDCVYFKYKFLMGKRLARCGSPNAKLRETSLVSRNHAPFCSSEREYGNCKTEGINWKENP